MTEHQEALVRTLKPVVGGSAIGLFLYFVFTNLPLPVIGVGIAFAALIGFTVLAYRMNLDSVRRERNKNRDWTG